MENSRGIDVQFFDEGEGTGRYQAKIEISEPESRPTEEALKQQLHFLQRLIDTVPNPIFYKDINNLYIGCNKAFEDRLGLMREDIIGKSAYDIFPAEIAEKYHEMDLALLRRPGEQTYEGRLLFADGRFHDVIIKKATFLNMDGTLGGLLGVTTDISSRKEAERELKKAHDELEIRVEQRTAELATTNEQLRAEIAERKRMQEALKQSADELKRFAYSVMHDLKSPAIGVNGLTRLLRRRYEDVLDEKGNGYCIQILRASEHLLALVKEINNYIAAKEAPLKIEETDLKEILQILRDEFSTQLSARRISWLQPKYLSRVRVDRLCILRAFRNYIDNALKYGGKSLSRIEIGYEESEHTHTFSVGDDGVGISRESAEEIFGAFRRNETSRGIEGSGLGLAIVREIAERHGGRVWVRPGKGGGSTFYFSIGKELCVS